MDNQQSTTTLSSPLWGALFIVLPQAILLLLLLSGYSLIFAEMEQEQINYTALILAFPAINVITFTFLALFLKSKQKTFSLKLLIPTAILQVLFLWISAYLLNDTIPQSVNRFIFPDARYLGFLFTFYMPAIYYPFQNISNIIMNQNTRRNFFISLGSIFGLPLLLYIFGQLASGLFRFHSSSTLSMIGSFLGIMIVILFTAMFIISLLNVLGRLVNKVNTKKTFFRYGSVFIIGVAMPIGGLYLNRSIPFPTNFQHWQIYAMAVANGLLLCVPQTKHKFVQTATFLVRAFFYPFTLYFFLVFLPFLPLSLFAIIAAGAGFLMLTPIVLFYIHTQILVSDMKVLSCWLDKRVLVGVTAAAIMGIPAVITINALVDKASLYKAVNFVYNPDYAESTDIYDDLPRIKRSLQDLYDFKAGIEMPYISQYYRWLVFDNLVLSDSKIEEIHTKLFGEKILPSPEGNSFNYRGSTRPRGLNGVSLRTRDKNIVISKHSTSIKSSANGVTTTQVSLELTNKGHRSNAEYAATLNLPKGAFITGFSLRINGENVPGRIFEKKSALWIYEKITSERKDPGLLYYKTPDTVRLHVFPFAAEETRHITIDLLYADELQPALAISEYKPIALPVSNLHANARYLLTPDELQALPSANRKPVAHLIIQHNGTDYNWEKIVPQLKTLGISKFAVTLANIDSNRKTYVNSLTAGAIQKRISETPLPQADGFMVEKALKKEILSWQSNPDEFPVFVVVSDKNSLGPIGNYDGFTEYLPETNEILHIKSTAEIVAINLSNNRSTEFKELSFNSAVRIGQKTVGTNTPVINGGIDHPHYATAFELQDLCRQLKQNPSSELTVFPQIVAKSKESGIMNPLTSFIVLESQAQWAMLDKVEKEKLENLSVLDVEEVKASEPPFIIMLIAIILFFAFRESRLKLKRTYT